VIKDLISDPDRLWYWLVMLSVFGLVLAVWYAVVTIWYLRRSRHREQLHGRLEPWSERFQTRRIQIGRLQSVFPKGASENAPRDDRRHVACQECQERRV